MSYDVKTAVMNNDPVAFADAFNKALDDKAAQVKAAVAEKAKENLGTSE